MAGKSKQAQPESVQEPEEQTPVEQGAPAETESAVTVSADEKKQEAVVEETPTETAAAVEESALPLPPVEEAQPEAVSSSGEREKGEAMTPEDAADVLAAGKQHLLRGAYEQAQLRFEQALAAMEQAADHAGLAEVHEQLAITYLLRAEYGRAGEAYGHAREFRRQIQDQDGEADILRQLTLLRQLDDKGSR